MRGARFFGGLLLLFLGGCSSLQTQKTQYAGIDRLLEKANYSKAISQVKLAREKKAYTHKDRVLYFLDLGMLLHWNQQYEQSNLMLEKAERAIEQNLTKSLSRSATSLILNDNLLPYAGEGYENVYLNAFKALNYLALGQTDNAFVEIRRIDLKLVELQKRYPDLAKKLNQAEESAGAFRAGPQVFVTSPLGRYLGMALYRNDQKWDDARIDLKKLIAAWQVQPALLPFPAPRLKNALKPPPESQARLELLVFTGRSPEKKAHTYFIHTEKDRLVLAHSAENYLGAMALDDLSYIPWKDIPEDYHFKIQLPEMKKNASKVSYVEVEIAGYSPSRLQRLESLENAAVSTFSAKKPLIFLRTVIRAVSKGLAASSAKQEMTKNMDETLAFFVRLASDLLLDSTENADLRSARFFPAEAFVYERFLPKGAYHLFIRYYSERGRLLYTDEKLNVSLHPGKLNFIESAYLN